jgi:hypothetical protein
MEYFATIAKEIRHISFYDWEPLKNLESKTAEIFGVKTPGRSGRGSIYSDYRKTLYEIQLAIAVRESVKDGNQVTYAYEQVAKSNRTSEPTVRRAYKKHQSLFSRKMPVS